MKEKKKEFGSFATAELDKGNDKRRLYGDEEIKFSEKTGAFRNEPAESQNKVYHTFCCCFAKIRIF
jgi:hypothetical protein